eukprot:UN13147
MDGGNDSVGGLDMEEIKRLRAMNLGAGGAGGSPMGNSLMVPGMEINEDQQMDMGDIKNDDQQMDQNDYGALQAPQMEINVPDTDQQQIQEQEQEQEELEDMNQDIDVQQ